MNFSEKDLEELIFKSFSSNNNRNKLIKKGLNVLSNYDLMFRQVDLGDYGRLDLLFINYSHMGIDIGCSKCINIMVMEIKKGEINIESYLQAVRYCKGLEILFQKTAFNCRFHVCLIGNSVCKSDFCYLPDIVDNLSIYSVELDLDLGIKFKPEEGYSLSQKLVMSNPTNTSVFSEYIKSKIKKFTKTDSHGLPF